MNNLKMAQMNNGNSTWKKYTLDKLGDYFNGRAFKKDEWKKDGLPIIRIQNLNNPVANFNYTDKSFEQKYKVEKGDLLVSWAASLGVYTWDRGDAWLNQHIFKVVPNEDLVTKDFLFYLLKSVIGELYLKTHGTGMVHITKGDFDSHEVYVPDIQTQNQIIKTLTTVLPLADNSLVNIQTAKAKLNDFRQSILATAVSGKSTEDWSPKKLKDVCLLITDGDHQAPPKAPTGVPFIVISDVNNGILNLNTKRFVPEDYFNNLKNIKKPQKGDVLYTTVGSFGIPIRVTSDDRFVFQRHIALLRPNNEIMSEYLFYLLKSRFVFNQAAAVATGTAQLTVPLSGLRNIEINLPSIEEQKTIVKKINEQMELANSIEQQIKKAEQYALKLNQSIMKKVFNFENN